jgi:maltooligosyltrehalose trehalohydrolase
MPPIPTPSTTTQLRVWAPRASRVDLALDGDRVPARADPGGWWSASVPVERAAAGYAFSLDGGPPRPDPRSPWQPDGVHAPSRPVDHAAFAWSDQGWRAPALAAGLIYELHVGTFTPAGTFEAAIERLDHLLALGVTHVELMPVAQFSGEHGWGYDGVALTAPHQPYGGPLGLKRLVDACHARGLAVLLDVVYNHLGPVGNYLAEFAPYFTDRHHTPWGAAVNLGEPEVRGFVIDNACGWLRDYHLDGLRLDAIHALRDDSATHLLAELADAVRVLERGLDRPLVLIAESDLNDPRVVRPAAQGGYGLDAQWNEDFHHALHALLTGERGGYYADFGRIADVATALSEGLVYAGRHSTYRGRPHGYPVRGLGGHAFVGCLQNHDQVGNRARGDRIGHLVSAGRLRIGAALVLTAPFVPMLFQGEEWNASAPFQYFTDHADPDVARAVREGRRREFAAFGEDPAAVPDPQARETFLRSKLDWAERTRGAHADVLDWYRRLIALRRARPALRDGRLEAVRVASDEDARWLRMEREDLTVACNLDDQVRCVPLARGRPRTVLLSSSAGLSIGPDTIDLPPDSVVVLGPEA